MRKLWDMGVTGRMLSWISNFLKDRTGTINMSGGIHCHQVLWKLKQWNHSRED